MTARVRPALLLLVLLSALASVPPAGAQIEVPYPCTALVPAGDDIERAIANAGPEAVVCLAAGIHRPFVVDRGAPAGMTIRAAVAGTSTVIGGSDAAVQIRGATRLTVADLTVRGGASAAVVAAQADDLTLRDLRAHGGMIGVDLDGGTSAQLAGVTIRDATDAGLVVRRGARVAAERLSVLESAGTGVAVLAGAGMVTIRDSEIGGALGPGVFAGVPGCGNVNPATLTAPDCFMRDPEGYMSDLQVELDTVLLRDGPGTGLVFFPGVRAELRSVTVRRWGMAGLFAWGATVDVTGSTFDASTGHGIEYRAFPDPRGPVIRTAAGTIADTSVRGTRALGGPVLGAGIMARGAQLAIGRTLVADNQGGGMAFGYGTTGEVAESSVLDNGGAGICFGPDVRVEVRDTTVTGNVSDEINAC